MQLVLCWLRLRLGDRAQESREVIHPRATETTIPCARVLTSSFAVTTAMRKGFKVALARFRKEIKIKNLKNLKIIGTLVTTDC